MKLFAKMSFKPSGIAKHLIEVHLVLILGIIVSLLFEDCENEGVVFIMYMWVFVLFMTTMFRFIDYEMLNSNKN